MPPQFRAHPWHGIPTGQNAPELVNAFIEIVPTDVVKYEVDKASGHLRVDRPQKYSNQCPALYGFVPQTYCGREISALAQNRAPSSVVTKGDGDPLDICVLTERPITRGDILLHARPIGGLGMIDKGEADDKIIAVLFEDAVCGEWTDITDCPKGLLDRLRHYFLTYKNIPGDVNPTVEIASVYGADEAKKVIQTSQRDYASEIADS